MDNSSHELPRWRSPSPMAASMIPPPIVESTYASPPKPVAQSIIIERSTPLQDRQSELEADLQFLLDAQAEGLVRGLEGGLADDQTSNGSTTPTAQSIRSSSAARRKPRPARQKPGLRSARKGIYNAMMALSTVKHEELQGIDENLRAKEQILEQIDEWDKKRHGLREAAQNVDSDEDTVRVKRLRQEADTLQESINHVELQLSDMKARHRKLTRQVAAVENSMQAKLASYTSSLKMLEEDVQKFLTLDSTEDTSRPRSSNGQASMWEIPAKRRTLGIARRHWKEERDAVMERRESTQHEKAALEEGTQIWREVVAQVTDFERLMRSQMAEQSMQPPDTPGDSTSANASQRLKELLSHMDRLVENLESNFELAKEQNWNLLVAAIGAELDALKQGRQLLDNVLRSTSSEPDEPDEPAGGPQNGSPGSDDEIHELDKSFETARRRMSNGHEADDDPDPELLFSRHDIDTV
ncbi:hypothetical protein LTR37_004391 [Vermiconidia calcicola]|uniref:Uncharacterized protein n=1 Tax=Vermiconidia calcicola TaxID=1690605 RepID=A0ACC3NQ99_9PEZI|nr:hypothetical protein LTR37_004391 [Vermiconidia calcicola]